MANKYLRECIVVGRHKAEMSGRRISVVLGLHFATALLLTTAHCSMRLSSGLLSLSQEAGIMGSSHGGIWLCTSQRGFRKMDLNIFLNHLLYGFYISELLFLDSKQIPDRVLVLSTKWWSSVSLHGNPSFIVPSFIAQWEEEDDCRNKVGSWHLGLCEAEYLVLGMDWLLGASANFYN